VIVTDHQLHGLGVIQAPSPNHGGKIDGPHAITIHYTAGRSYERSLASLRNGNAPKGKRRSAHLLIARSGVCAQLVRFDQVAWHAGVSSWKGREHCNSWMLGIELDNFGLLHKTARGFETYFGQLVPIEEVYFGARDANDHRKYWHAYTEPQLAMLEQVLPPILTAYAPITELVGHEDISPGRKLDPGEAFPWARFTPLLQTAA